MATIRPKDLPAGTPNNTAALIFDTGSVVQKSTPLGVVDAGVPLASQAQAEAGTDNATRMSPLRTAQAIALLGVTLADLASTAPGKGASLVRFQNGNTVEDLSYRTAWLTPSSPISDSSAQLNALLANPLITTIHIPAGNWRFDSQIYVEVSRDIQIIGEGSGKTNIDFNHLGEGIVLYTTNNVPSTFIATARIEGITVTRSAGVGYTGTARPRNISLWNFFEPVIRDVDSSGHIGYGVSCFRSVRPLFENVRSHDANGGTLGGGMLAPSGTDGIHAFQCDGPTFRNCQAWNVGDDCISNGSLQDDVGAYMRTRNARVIGCRAWNTINGAGFKVYGHNEGAFLTDIYATATQQGAVYVTDHDDAAAFVMKNVTVDGLKAIDCRGPTSTNVGVIRVRLYPTTTQTTAMDNLVFRNIDAVGCRALLTIDGSHPNPSTNYVNDVLLEKVSFRDAARIPGDEAFQANAITLSGMRGTLGLRGITMENIIGSAFRASTSSSYANFSRLAIEDFSVDGYGYTGGSSSTDAISVAQPGLLVEANKVTAVGQIRGATVTPANSMTFTDIAPASVMNELNTEGDPAPVFSGVSSYRTYGPRLASAQPSAGTWLANDYVSNTATGTGIRGWRCTLSGTYGTLSSVTASGASGERKIVVNDATNLRKGHVISTASGIPGGRAVIAKIEGTTIYLSVALNANITAGTTVSFATPIWVIDPDPLLVTDTATNIASAAATINLNNKFTGKMIWDSTNTRQMRANGTATTSTWTVVDGSATVTPV